MQARSYPRVRSRTSLRSTGREFGVLTPRYMFSSMCREQGLFKGLSFPTISATGPNGGMMRCHRADSCGKAELAH